MVSNAQGRDTMTPASIWSLAQSKRWSKEDWSAFGRALLNGTHLAAFLLDQLTEWRQGLTHAIWPPAVRSRISSLQEFTEGLYINNVLSGTTKKSAPSSLLR
jgi:hypothetical protein